jgi:hypothetical protein
VKAEVPQGGVSRHEAAVSYDLPPPKDDTDRALNPGPGEYHDYVRFYLPETALVSRLDFSQDGGPSGNGGGIDRISFEHGRQVVASFFRLPRGHRAEVHLFYQVPLPPQSSYQLFIQKQAGIPGRDTTVQVSYPGGQATRQSDLSQDFDWEVRW